MTAEAIIQKIISDAEQQATAIRTKAEQQARTIKTEASQHAKKQAQDIYNSGIQRADNRKKILISQAHQQLKRKEMNAKEDIINTCFDNALDRLTNLNETEYKDLIKHFIEQGKKQISGEFSIKTSRDLDKKIAKELQLPISGETTATGGIVLVSKDGAITVDYTFEGILKREKQRIRVTVGKLLFG